MASIYVSDEFNTNYHFNFPVTQSHLTGGMPTRYSALHYAFRLPLVTSIGKVAGDLLIEPFALKPRPSERESQQVWDRYSDEWKAMEDRYAQQIQQYNRGRKFLLCSEMEVMRWREELRSQVVSTLSGVFATCQYQKNLLSAVNIKASIVAEPVHEYLFYPGDKKPRQIVACGATIHVKNVEMLIEFYRALEGKGFHRVFIGGPMVWGNWSNQRWGSSFKYNRTLLSKLQAVCDEFHDPAPATKVARIFSESEFYANFAIHEVGCRTVLEALMAGCGVIWGTHPLGDEMPVLCQASTVAEAVEAVEKNTGNVDVDAMRDHAYNQHAYSSVKAELERLMYAH